jgi:hypothetical protein
MICKVPKTAKKLKIAFNSNEWSQKLHNFLFAQTQKYPP